MTRVFGPIEGIPTGAVFKNREELRKAGAHMPLEGGISGAADEGADSIVLSGGYPDDQFNEDTILYTGSGKRDPHTDKVVEDQKLIKQNKALAKSCDDGLPVRVIRAIGPRRKQLPKGGYHYEGIYYIDRYSRVIGVDGYWIWQFYLVRQPEAESYIESISTQKRVFTTVQRIVRNTLIANMIKELYKHKCQICDVAIKTPRGFYSEGAHIRPLGANHNGPDEESNLLCLCPNHHVMLDRGSIYIDRNFNVRERSGHKNLGRLYVHPLHVIDEENLTYQKQMFDE